jgi:hypothetical protein
MEREHKVSEKEDDESYNSKDDDVVTPSHIVINPAAWLSRCDSFAR